MSGLHHRGKQEPVGRSRLDKNGLRRSATSPIVFTVRWSIGANGLPASFGLACVCLHKAQAPTRLHIRQMISRAAFDRDASRQLQFQKSHAQGWTSQQYALKATRANQALKAPTHRYWRRSANKRPLCRACSFPNAFNGTSDTPCKRWEAFQSVWPCRMIYSVGDIHDGFVPSKETRIAF